MNKPSNVIALCGILLAAVALVVVSTPIPVWAASGSCTVTCPGGASDTCSGSEEGVDYDCEEDSCWEGSGSNVTVKYCPLEQ